MPNKWRFCPEGFICVAGTNLGMVNNKACPAGYFCKLGSQSEKEALLCPAGRICHSATSVKATNQIQTCANEDPNFCQIGEICMTGFFCGPGQSDILPQNSCMNLNSFNGARERFFCTRSSTSKKLFLIF